MKTWLKLLLPIGLGLIAVFINTTVMNSKLRPKELIVVRKNMKTGDIFTPADIESREFSGDVASLVRAAIPWSERAVLFGREVPRDLIAGDLVLSRDATPPALELKPNAGEASLPVSLEGVASVPRLLLVGEEIGFIIDKRRLGGAQTGPLGNVIQSAGQQLSMTQAAVEPDYVGPFRVLGVGQRLTRTDVESDTGGAIEQRIITIAIKLGPDNDIDPEAEKLIKAINSPSGRGGLLSIVLKRSVRSPDAS